MMTEHDDSIAAFCEARSQQLMAAIVSHPVVDVDPTEPDARDDPHWRTCETEAMTLADVVDVFDEVDWMVWASDDRVPSDPETLDIYMGGDL